MEELTEQLKKLEDQAGEIMKSCQEAEVRAHVLTYSSRHNEGMACLLNIVCYSICVNYGGKNTWQNVDSDALILVKICSKQTKQKFI